MTKTHNLIAWMLRNPVEETVWVGVLDNYLLIGRWSGDYWVWDVTATVEASAQAVEATSELELIGYTMHAPPMWMDVDDPEFLEGLGRWARPTHPELDDRVCRAFSRAVVLLAVAGQPV